MPAYTARIRLHFILALVLLSIAGCSSKRIKPEPPSPPQPVITEPAPVQIPDVVKPDTVIKPAEPVKTTDYSVLKPADWADIDG
jgi:hypothetical protein